MATGAAIVNQYSARCLQILVPIWLGFPSYPYSHCLTVLLQDRGFTSSSNVIKTGKTQSSFQTPGAG